MRIYRVSQIQKCRTEDLKLEVYRALRNCRSRRVTEEGYIYGSIDPRCTIGDKFSNFVSRQLDEFEEPNHPPNIGYSDSTLERSGLLTKRIQP